MRRTQRGRAPRTFAFKSCALNCIPLIQNSARIDRVLAQVAGRPTNPRIQPVTRANALGRESLSTWPAIAVILGGHDEGALKAVIAVVVETQGRKAAVHPQDFPQPAKLSR